MTLPNKRIIESATYGREDPDVTEEEAREIVEAISLGRLLFFACTSGPDKHTNNHNEVDLTYYRDPRSGEFRYAVETWLGARKWITDFDNETSARACVAEDRRMVGL